MRLVTNRKLKQERFFFFKKSAKQTQTQHFKCQTYSFGAPAATVAHVGAVQVLDVYLIHHFGVLFLNLQVNQAVPLLLLLGQERPNGQVAQQSQDTQQRQQPEPLGH